MQKWLLILAAFFCISCGAKKQAPVSPEYGEAMSPEKSGIFNMGGIPLTPADFQELIWLTNCSVTDEYTVPVINNRITDLDGAGPIYRPVEKNDIQLSSSYPGVDIFLEKDIQFHGSLRLIAKNSLGSYEKDISLNEMYAFDEPENLFGFYSNAEFENKFWLDDGGTWEFTVMSGGLELVKKQLEVPPAIKVFVEKFDNTPFIINDTKEARIQQKYTFRCRKTDADIIVMYYTPNYSVYYPVLYLLPAVSGDMVEINISWLDEKIKGVYHIIPYRLQDMPDEVKTMAVFDFIQVN
ncbi:hypothetical protein K7I13_09805 [Brucepastera parasyntrophica]|uniref:hypothetical protein n=1 Tax=Brucepastera parasyntrophica TaxID=2880008 RepID=UPI0021089F05|nr:hypothetical protein [Brucepastera parasyntrophica]ULQ58827.1 hypothetical protein K7I13_09805 [Brucepastera parasyntrophica]